MNASEKNDVNKPEDWFHNSIVTGLQMLINLNLRGKPATDMVQHTAALWIRVLWRNQSINWNQTFDQPRIESTFWMICESETEFPSPARFLELLRQCTDRDYQQAQLPQRTWSLEERRANIQRLKAEINKAFAKP